MQTRIYDSEKATYGSAKVVASFAFFFNVLSPITSEFAHKQNKQTKTTKTTNTKQKQKSLEILTWK